MEAACFAAETNPSKAKPKCAHTPAAAALRRLLSHIAPRVPYSKTTAGFSGAPAEHRALAVQPLVLPNTLESLRS